MAKKSSNIIEKMMDPNIIDYNIINCAIPLIITIKNRYQIHFGKPVFMFCVISFDELIYALGLQVDLSFGWSAAQKVYELSNALHQVV